MDLFLLFFFQVVFAVHIRTPLVKANDALLSFSLLFSLVVTFLCSIVFLGEPQHWSCMTSQVALALGFALCLSSIMGEYKLYCCVCMSWQWSSVTVLSIYPLLCDSGKATVLMLRAQALKAARIRAKAAAKAAKAAAEAAANSGSPDVIVTNTNNNNEACANPEVDRITCGHQRAIAAVATLIQVSKERCQTSHSDPAPVVYLTSF